MSLSMSMKHGNNQSNNYGNAAIAKEYTGRLAPAISPWMDFESEPAYSWKEDAACAFQPYTLFEIADNESPISEGLNREEIKDLNNANFERAAQICATCPVLAECEADATDDDFNFSFRAGKVPTFYSARTQGRPEGSRTNYQEYEEGQIETCRNGHVNQYRWVENGKRRRCHGCEADLRRSKGIPAAIHGSELCARGHSNWKINPTDGKRRCHTCNLESRRRRAAK